jgi:hypothetical protein
MRPPGHKFKGGARPVTGVEFTRVEFTRVEFTRG